MSDEDFETYRDYIDAWVFDSNEYDDEGMARERGEVLDFLSRIQAERDTLQRENERLQAGMHRFSVVVKERDTLQRENATLIGQRNFFREKEAAALQRVDELEGVRETAAALLYPDPEYDDVLHMNLRQALKNTEKEQDGGV